MQNPLWLADHHVDIESPTHSKQNHRNSKMHKKSMRATGRAGNQIHRVALLVGSTQQHGSKMK
jgi:hypothetical protein